MALRPSVWVISLVLVALAGQPSLAHAGKLRKIWEFDLGKVALKGEGDPALPVFAIRFSPDGRKLAVIADVYGKGHEVPGEGLASGWKHRLMVIGVDHPAAGPREFEIPFGISEDEHGRGLALNFGWSPSGEIVYAVGRVIHLDSGATCDLPNGAVFISDEVAVSVRPEPLQQLTHMALYDQSCGEREHWDVLETWLVSDVSLDRRLLSVVRETATPGNVERLIVDPLARKVLLRRAESKGGSWEFADSGKAICQGGSVLLSDHAPAICRSVDTGEEIGQTLRNGANPIATAAQATRFVASDYQRVKIPFDYEYRDAFRGRFVWDFGVEKELASWKPESETYMNVVTPTKQITEPFRFAMSPDGRLLVEGGGGIIRLYKIEP